MPLKTKAEIDEANESEKSFLARLDQPTASTTDKPDSSSSSDDEDDKAEIAKAPESPGKWEIMPGSSATRPQFIKVKPGESIEAAVARKKGIDTKSQETDDEKQQQQQPRPRKISSRFFFYLKNILKIFEKFKTTPETVNRAKENDASVETVRSLLNRRGIARLGEVIAKGKAKEEGAKTAAATAQTKKEH